MTQTVLTKDSVDFPSSITLYTGDVGYYGIADNFFTHSIEICEIELSVVEIDSKDISNVIWVNSDIDPETLMIVTNDLTLD